jgi:aryl-alcohol dehydrogenase-like predicted oxidoreductase
VRDTQSLALNSAIDTHRSPAPHRARWRSYTHIDTALGYLNQVGVGRAIKASGRKRDSFFITSKIPGGLNTSAAAASLDLSLEQLGLDYVDLMLVHFPATWGGDGGAALRVEEWKALEVFHKAGKARAIGVSHYCKHHLLDIMSIATVKPAINQVQFHVGMGTAGPNATDDRACVAPPSISLSLHVERSRPLELRLSSRI